MITFVRRPHEAHSFIENPEVRTAMADAGVDASSLRVEFYEQA